MKHFIQAMITATEAKTKALHEEQIYDAHYGTIATGTATDSLLVAATQSGEEMPYAGPITEVGKLIGHGVFETTVKAIRKYKAGLKMNEMGDDDETYTQEQVTQGKRVLLGDVLIKTIYV